ncbi:hypothetical protein CsatB_004573 [Cannabis sativa]
MEALIELCDLIKMVSFVGYNQDDDEEPTLKFVTSVGDYVIEKVLNISEMKQHHKDLPYFLQLSHCNGIVHIFGLHDDSTVFYNPTLRKFKLLRGPICFPPNFVEVVGSGFGYDSKSNVYKCVKIFCNKDCRDLIAMVHTLGTNNWREVKIEREIIESIPNLNNSHWRGLGSIYVKDALYWCCYSYSTQKGLLLSFNMSNEVFCSIQIPHHVVEQLDCRRKLMLVEWNGSVGLFFGVKEANNSDYMYILYELWVIESTTNWIKILKIGPLQRFYWPFTFWKNGEILMNNYNNLYKDEDYRIIASYNVYTKQLKKMVYGVRSKFFFTCVTPYLKTLVSV